jgi:hypothetical protein
VSGGQWEAWEQVAGRDDVDAMEVLRTASMYERYFQEVQKKAVQVVRAEGGSWQEIADAVGTTKQSAWQKWRSDDEMVELSAKQFRSFRPPRTAMTVFSAGIQPLLGARSPKSLRKKDCLPFLELFVDSSCSPDKSARGMLVDAAWNGLKKAMDKYGSTDKVVPFAVYAAWWVQQAVERQRRERPSS